MSRYDTDRSDTDHDSPSDEAHALAVSLYNNLADYYEERGEPTDEVDAMLALAGRPRSSVAIRGLLRLAERAEAVNEREGRDAMHLDMSDVDGLGCRVDRLLTYLGKR